MRQNSSIAETLSDVRSSALTGDSTLKVSVVIVTYGSRNELPQCMESLQRQSVPTEVFIVDNNSPDETAELAQSYSQRFDNVFAIINQHNIGLAAANNSPLHLVQGEYVLILNPDTLLRPDTLERMASFLDANPDVAVVGPKNVYADGTPHSSFHTQWNLLHILLWRVLPYRILRQMSDRSADYRLRDVLFVSGACLMIRRRLFQQIGGYDAEFFLTVEDACDLCIRARDRGGRIVFLPDAEVVHHGGRSGVQAPYIVVWQGYRGSIYFFLKHKGKSQALLVSGVLLLSAGARTAVASILGLLVPRYRKVADIYGRVFRSILLQNPIRESSLLALGNKHR